MINCGYKVLNCRVDSDMHKEVKALCAKKGVSIDAFICKLLLRELKKKGAKDE